MAEIKKSAVAAAETKNIKPSYYYITKIMKFIDTVEDRYRLVKDFYSINQDDLSEEDKVKTRVMMNLLEMQLEQKQLELEQREQANIRDNETKIVIAQIQASNNEDDGIEEQEFSEEAKANLEEKIREFNERLKLDRDKLEFDKKKANTDAELKRMQINKKPSSNK